MRLNDVELFENIILKTEVLPGNANFKVSRDDLHIAFGIDANFAMGMGVCMTSVILNNPKENIIFHIFTDKIHAEDFKKLQLLAKYSNVVIIMYYINLAVFKNFKTSVGWTYATYYRFVMGKTLQSIADKVLYLDADVLCIGNLHELKIKDMGTSIVIAICDFIENFRQRMQELNIVNGQYFNAGVIYIDVKRWCEATISERAMQLLSDNPDKYKSLDQDVLNILLDNKTTFIENKWNYMYNVMTMKHEIPQDTKLIHFTGDKPWQKWTEHNPVTTIYYDYIKKSPWHEDGLVAPVHYKDKRKMARSYMKRRMYLTALQWYWQYLKARRIERK